MAGNLYEPARKGKLKINASRYDDGLEFIKGEMLARLGMGNQCA
jgi:hypothetical protein